MEGKRVELSPSHDLWMQGAKIGTITKRLDNLNVEVKLDNYKKQVIVPIAELKPLDDPKLPMVYGSLVILDIRSLFVETENKKKDLYDLIKSVLDVEIRCKLASMAQTFKLF